MLDGRRLATGERVRWTPWPGRHRLTLLGPDRAVLQTVVFEVRGASVRAPQGAVRRPVEDVRSALR
jgi:penicillin-binding protein 1C